MESQGATARVGVIPIVVGSMGLLAAILAFSAEGSRVTDPIVLDCEVVRNPVNSIAISAVVVLLITQVLGTAWGGRMGGNYVSPSLQKEKTKLATTYLASSWMACIVGFSLLIYGAAKNGKSRIQYYTDGTYNEICNAITAGVLGTGGALFLVSTGLLVAYILQVGSTSTDGTIHQQQAEMGPTGNANIDFNYTGKRSQLGPEA